MLSLNLMGIFVNNPRNALVFYTTKLGFVKKTIHDNYITVGTEDGNVELVLESNENELAKNYQKQLYKQGVPAASLCAENLDKECQRLIELGIKFTTMPTKMLGIRLAIFDDEQGNLIQLVETKD